MSTKTLVPVELPTCGDCGAVAHPSASVCEECGRPLLPEPFDMGNRHGRDCPCTDCTLAFYDGQWSQR